MSADETFASVAAREREKHPKEVEQGLGIVRDAMQKQPSKEMEGFAKEFVVEVCVPNGTLPVEFGRALLEVVSAARMRTTPNEVRDAVRGLQTAGGGALQSAQEFLAGSDSAAPAIVEAVQRLEQARDAPALAMVYDCASDLDSVFAEECSVVRAADLTIALGRRLRTTADLAAVRADFRNVAAFAAPPSMAESRAAFCNAPSRIDCA